MIGSLLLVKEEKANFLIIGGKTMKKIIIILNIFFLSILVGCKGEKELLIVTTTSLDNSGLLEYILPAFEEEYDCKVKVVALGTGAALEMGSRGEADILLVHDLDRELQFIEDGYGEKRHNIMYNDFIYVGPEALNATNLLDALTEMKENHNFFSRGDNSGTHSRELKIWTENNFDVSSFGDWYQETGQGMGSTLTMSSISGHYTLTDRGTYLSMRENLNLVVAYENDPQLLNQYGVIKVSEDLHNRDTELADLFYNWIIREDTQELIGTYIKYDTVLFNPNSGD